MDLPLEGRISGSSTGFEVTVPGRQGIRAMRNSIPLAGAPTSIEPSLRGLLFFCSARFLLVVSRKAACPAHQMVAVLRRRAVPGPVHGPTIAGVTWNSGGHQNDGFLCSTRLMCKAGQSARDRIGKATILWGPNTEVSKGWKLDVIRDHRRAFEDSRYVYAVVSRRSKGVSIGINLNPDKVCNFDCVYCQVDRKTPPVVRDVDVARLREELEDILDRVQSGELFETERFRATPPALRRLN